MILVIKVSYNEASFLTKLYPDNLTSCPKNSRTRTMIYRVSKCRDTFLQTAPIQLHYNIMY